MVAPLIRAAKRGGRQRSVQVREALNAILYVLATGCQWKALPKDLDLAASSTVYDYFGLWEWDLGSWRISIVKRTDRHRFAVLPKRRVVERTIAWVSRNRRLARDVERHARKTAAFVRLAMIRTLLRRVTANPSP